MGTLENLVCSLCLFLFAFSVLVVSGKKISLKYHFSFIVLIDVSESPTDEKKPIDIYAVGFEEMVDLDAKNIMNAR